MKSQSELAEHHAEWMRMYDAARAAHSAYLLRYSQFGEESPEALEALTARCIAEKRLAKFQSVCIDRERH